MICRSIVVKKMRTTKCSDSATPEHLENRRQKFGESFFDQFVMTIGETETLYARDKNRAQENAGPVYISRSEFFCKPRRWWVIEHDYSALTPCRRCGRNGKEGFNIRDLMSWGVGYLDVYRFKGIPDIDWRALYCLSCANKIRPIYSRISECLEVKRDLNQLKKRIAERRRESFISRRQQ